jgi:hypothetical protein
MNEIGVIFSVQRGGRVLSVYRGLYNSYDFFDQLADASFEASESGSELVLCPIYGEG